MPLEKLGVTQEQLQRKRKRVGRQAYRKFANEDDSEDAAEPEEEEEDGTTRGPGEETQRPRGPVDYGTHSETRVSQVSRPSAAVVLVEIRGIQKQEPFRRILLTLLAHHGREESLL